MDIFELLRLAKSRGASDLHIVAYSPPLVRIHGELLPLADLPPLTAEDIVQIFNQVTTDRQKSEFQNSLELDFGYEVDGIGRIRCNVARQRGTISLVIRLLLSDVPSLEELGLPAVCKELILKRRGLVVVSGPTGSGKSTTLAAMVGYLNGLESRRVVTIEDPVEYIYSSRRCIVTQRELGSDTLSFAGALKHVLRQDPDVILVGEMRDPETATTALSVAETGHLVLTTGHAPSSSQAIERIIDLFPVAERHLAQSRLASLLQGILCQALVPKASGSGRVAAVEVMLGNPAIKNLIREGKIYQLPNTIRMHNHEGMQLLDQALINLHRSGTISDASLLSYCDDRVEVARVAGLHTEANHATKDLPAAPSLMS